MTRPLCLVAALAAALATAASAQPADSLGAPATVPTAELALGGFAAGAAVTVVVGSLTGTGEWVLGMYPLGVALGVTGVARARGAEPPFGKALLGAGAGALIGVGSAVAVLLLTDADIFSDGPEILVAGTLVLAGPIVGAVVTASPVVLRAPSGEPVPGASLRIAL